MHVWLFFVRHVRVAELHVRPRQPRRHAAHLLDQGLGSPHHRVVVADDGRALSLFPLGPFPFRRPDAAVSEADDGGHGRNSHHVRFDRVWQPGRVRQAHLVAASGAAGDILRHQLPPHL